MNCSLFGLRGRDFTLVASDMTLARSVVTLHREDKKHYTIWDRVTVGYNGEPGSANQLLSYAREKMKFESLRNRIPITAEVTANIIQKTIHASLRGSPCAAECLVGDRNTLFAVDAYGAMWKADYACMGYAQYFLYGILDKDWEKDVSLEAGMEIVRKCVSAMKDRFVLGSTRYSVRIVTDQGTEERIVNAFDSPQQ